MIVTVEVTGGAYEGIVWTGQLGDAPVTILVPEGIVSDRTTREASWIRDDIAAAYAGGDCRSYVLSSVRWSITVSAVEVLSGGVIA